MLLHHLHSPLRHPVRRRPLLVSFDPEGLLAALLAVFGAALHYLSSYRIVKPVPRPALYSRQVSSMYASSTEHIEYRRILSSFSHLATGRGTRPPLFRRGGDNRSRHHALRRMGKPCRAGPRTGWYVPHPLRSGFRVLLLLVEQGGAADFGLCTRAVFNYIKFPRPRCRRSYRLRRARRSGEAPRLGGAVIVAASGSPAAIKLFCRSRRLVYYTSQFASLAYFR